MGKLLLLLASHGLVLAFGFALGIYAKLRSCATLFANVSPSDPVFGQLLAAFYDGERDERTLWLLDAVRGEK